MAAQSDTVSIFSLLITDYGPVDEKFTQTVIFPLGFCHLKDVYIPQAVMVFHKNKEEEIRE